MKEDVKDTKELVGREVIAHRDGIVHSSREFAWQGQMGSLPGIGSAQGLYFSQGSLLVAAPLECRARSGLKTKQNRKRNWSGRLDGSMLRPSPVFNVS